MTLEEKNKLIQELKKKEIALTSDFRHGRWEVPAVEVSQRQSQIRQLRYAIQAIEEEFLVETQPKDSAERVKLLPLVLRRRLSNTPIQTTEIGVDAAGKRIVALTDTDYHFAAEHKLIQKDFELFTFEPIQTIEVETKICDCENHLHRGNPTDPTKYRLDEIKEHLQVCPNLVDGTVSEELYQVKHTRGNWKCRGCLEAAPDVTVANEQVQLVASKMAKQIRWCPNFIQGLMDLGPMRYALEISKINPNLVICYGGLLHSQFTISVGQKDQPDVAEMVYNCDTCGYSVTEKKEIPKAIEPGQVLAGAQQ